MRAQKNSASATEFARQVFAFIRGITLDHHLLVVDVRVGTFLADCFCRAKQGEAYPKLKTIAEAVNTSERTVLRAIDRLRRFGHLTVILGQPGRGHPNHYFMTADATAPARVIKLRQPRRKNTETLSPVSPFADAGKGDIGAEKGDTSAVEPLKEPLPDRGCLKATLYPEGERVRGFLPRTDREMRGRIRALRSRRELR